MWKDYKYLLAYIMPLMALWGLLNGNYWTYLGIFFAFVFIPIIETFSKGSTENIGDDLATELSGRIFFDLLLYLNLPLLYFILISYFKNLVSYNTFELIGATLSTGIMIGVISINVAHELGHRATSFEQFLSKMLLLPAFYIHFFIEHNKGHHKNVATDIDPASARYGEIIYSFWLRSIIGGYRSAWEIETNRLNKKQLSYWSIYNQMIQFHILEALYLIVIAYTYGFYAALAAIGIAFIGVLLLESVNYIEHYGLRREKMPNGYYEKVMPWHSWNSNHNIGRIVLYELTRHSDHHYKSTKKYQTLNHHEKSPQLPYGYPASILISLLPPIWFKIMNKKVLEIQK